MPNLYQLFDLTEVDQEGSKTGQSQAAIHGKFSCKSLVAFKTFTL